MPDPFPRLRAAWLRLPPSVRWGVTLFVIVRVFWWVWGALVMAAVPQPPPPQSWTISPVPPLTGLAGSLLEPWNRWDVLWYNRIAVQGYGTADGRSAFGPILPLLLNGLGALLGQRYLLAGFLISDLFCLGSLILLYEIAHRDGVDGRRTLILLLVYPFSFFLFVPYTEPLLLFVSLGAFWAARQGRWLIASLCVALAVLTKVTALVLLLPLALELWENRRTHSLWNGVWLVLAPFSLVLWILLRQFLLTGQGLSFSGPYGLLTPFISQDFQAGWSTEVVSLPWDSLIAAVLAPARLWPHIDALVALVDVVMTVVVVYLIALTLRLPRRSYIVYTLAVFVMNLMLIVQSTPLIDAPRRWMMAFPLFIAAAIYLPHRWERLWILFAVPLQLALTVLFIKWIMAG